MKKILLVALLFPFLNSIAQENYYFKSEDKFNSEIKAPSEFLGYEVGDHHTRYDIIVEYMKYLSEASDRVSFEQFGESVERRPQIMLTITSPDNFTRLDQIQSDHLKLSDPINNKSADLTTPLVLQLGFNVHGNEASGGEASLLTAYYFAAYQGDDMDNILRNSVIFIEPVLNPDGRARFATWVNMNRSNNPSPDGNDREHTEAWPGGRTNHYWYDLNRDWLPLVQQESKNRMARFQKWRPNVITDHHEMGTNSSFFFEPTKPGSENTIVPAENYTKLNTLFAKEYAKVLDDAGHYYDSGRSFDNSYPGYGSSYADVNGGLAILFEQASTRGLIQTTDLGYDMHFSLGIKNQFLCAISTIRTSISNHEMLNDYMFRFYKDAVREAATDRYKAYVFGDNKDMGRTNDFASLLLSHGIEVYSLKQDIQAGSNYFIAGKSFLVPTNQPQYKMVRTMFEAQNEFPDSLFYDATAWALVYAYGLPFSGVTKQPVLGEIVSDFNIEARPVTKSDYGYIFEWSEYYSAAALNMIQESGLIVKSAWEPVKVKSGDELLEFGRGSIFIPVNYQDLDQESIYKILSRVSQKTGISIFPVNSSMTADGPWMGNGLFRSIESPKLLMITGNGISSSSAGTIWDMLDNRVGMTFTRVDITRISRVNLYDYSTIILPSGNYSSISDSFGESLAGWVRNGGRVIAVGSSMSFLRELKLISYETNRAEQNTERINYDISRQASGKHSIGGIFCDTDLDNTHPLGFGYSTRSLTVYKNNRNFVKQLNGSTSNIVVYKQDPVISGYVSLENKKLFNGCASLLYFRSGRGGVTTFVDDPVFRGCWRGTEKLMMNAIFFGGRM